MKQTLSLSLFLICLCLIITSGKIEKNVTIGRASDCKGLAFNCPAKVANTIKATYVFAEPNAQSFSMEFKQEDIDLNGIFAGLLSNKTEFPLEEDFSIPDDVAMALQMPKDYKIKKGIYPMQYKNKMYTVVFHE
jgi:hypothetical protein